MKGKPSIPPLFKIDCGSWADWKSAPVVLETLAEAGALRLIKYQSTPGRTILCVSQTFGLGPYLLHHSILPLVRLDPFLYLFDNFCCISGALRFEIVSLGFFFAKYHHLRMIKTLSNSVTDHRRTTNDLP